MDSKDKHNGTLKTVYEDDEDNGSSEETPTVEATPRGPYQREIERLTRQLLECVKTTWQSLQWLTVYNKTSGTAREVLDKMEKRL